MSSGRSTQRDFARGAPWVPAILLLLIGVSAGGVAGHPMAVPYSSATAGNLEVTFPSAYPDVELGEVGNTSVVAGLSVDQILESTASPTAPQIVAVALPSNVVATNGSGSSGSGGPLLGLTATLTVYPSNAGLWQGPNDLVQADGAPLGTAQLSINYSFTGPTSASRGVTTHWEISGWPWQSSSDLLGIQLSLATPGAHSVVACTGSPSPVDSPGCAGTGVTGSPGVWGSEVLGLQGAVPNGPTALVSWDPDFGTSKGSTSPVSAGALATTPSLGHLLLAAPGQGASRVTGNIAFSLLPAIPPLSAPFLVHGNSTWYLAGIAASGLAGFVGLLGFRARQRSVEREL